MWGKLLVKAFCDNASCSMDFGDEYGRLTHFSLQAPCERYTYCMVGVVVSYHPHHYSLYRGNAIGRLFATIVAAASDGYW